MGEPNGRRATIADVARRAEVSLKTVSRVLNGSPEVLAATRGRVEHAMRELDYVANSSARRLAGGGLCTLGLVIPAVADLYSPYLFEVVQGVLATAEEAGYRTFLIPGQARPQPADEYVRLLREGHADGLIVLVRPVNLAHIACLAESGLPAVAIDDGLLRPNLPSVQADNHGGARAAVEHLLKLGHRRIAHIAGPPPFGCSHEREAGYRAALAAAGLAGAAHVVQGDFAGAACVGAAEELLALEEPPTAIFCGNDVTALAVLDVARRRGRRVGLDVAVVGFDDTRAALGADPPLTTVHQPLVDFGRRAGQMLVARLQGAASPVRHEVLGCRLVVRASCGARVTTGREMTPMVGQGRVEAWDRYTPT